MKKLIKHLEKMLGKDGATFVMSILCDCLDGLVEGTNGRELRTLEINFAKKFNFGTGEYES